MLTEEEARQVLLDQGLWPGDRISAEDFDKSVRDLMNRSPRPSAGSPPQIARVGDFLDEAYREKVRAGLARRRAADVTPPPELAVPACAVCEDSRFVVTTRDPFHPLFGKALPCPNCQLGPSAADRFERAGIPAEYKYMTFAMFLRAANPEAYERVLAWDGLRSIVLAGLPGRGKTHLAVAALRREIEERGASGHYTYVPRLLDELRRRYGDDAEGSSQAYMDSLAAWPLLLLDDVGSEHPTPWVTERLVLLLERRLQEGLVTIVTTNYEGTRGLEDHYGGALEGARLASRLSAGVFTWIAAVGEDMRQYDLGVDD